MTEAYWIAHVTVTDHEAYKGYQAVAPEAFDKYGAVFLARGGKAEALEGAPFERHVVIRFDNYAAALECYNSPEYSAARAKRKGACEAQIVIVEGLETA
jgi:uncharacterized protein (DUF1330 family)